MTMGWLNALRMLSRSACRLRRGRKLQRATTRTVLRCLPTGILRSARCAYPPPAPVLRRRIA
jgi:hypothetical protein